MMQDQAKLVAENADKFVVSHPEPEWKKAEPFHRFFVQERRWEKSIFLRRISFADLHIGSRPSPALANEPRDLIRHARSACGKVTTAASS